MKVNETVHHQDGSVTERQLTIDFEKGISQVAWTICPTNQEPFAVKILQSGWQDHGSPMYHVLTEWGAYEETSYSHLTQEQLLERYPEFKAILDHHFQDIIVTSEEFQSMPNDGEIGRYIRRKSLKK